MAWPFRKSAATTVVIDDVLSTPVPTPKPVVVGDDDVDSYRRVAESIGFNPGQLLEARVRKFCADNGIRVYDEDEVDKYLDKIFKKGWGWKPLRKEDDGKLIRNGYTGNGQILRRPYQGVPPLPVLLTVQRLVEEFPNDGLRFYVSDSAKQPEGDPFLAVTGIGMNLLIIERWDEPAFQPTK